MFYPNAQVYRIDSIYEGGTIRLQKSFYVDTESMENSDISEKNHSWMQIESEGEFELIEGKYWIQRGLWKYWDKNGKLKLETFQHNQSGTKYINQWLPDGTQILRNGNGYFYQIGIKRNTDYGHDSAVYEIKDSMKNGVYTVWCPLENGGFYRCETGQYIDNIQQPVQISFFNNGQVQTIRQYMNKELEGEYHSFFDNGVYSQYGRYHEGLKTGNWKYWNSEGVLIKECRYKKGRLHGHFTEFYSNGNTKQAGSYVHISGTDTITLLDASTFEEIIETEERDDIPVRDGEWYFYNQNGSLLKIEKYRKGELVIE